MWILSPVSIFYILILQDHVTACLSVFHGFSLFYLYSVLLLLLFCKERTADDDSVPSSVQCLGSKRLRFTSNCFVLFCQCSCDSWFVFVFICVVCFEFGLLSFKQCIGEILLSFILLQQPNSAGLP